MLIIDKIVPLFDKNGRFYLNHDEKIYEIIMDEKPELFPIINSDNFRFEIEENPNIGKLFVPHTLKHKLIQEYVKDKLDKQDDQDEQDEPDEQDDLNLESDTYFKLSGEQIGLLKEIRNDEYDKYNELTENIIDYSPYDTHIFDKNNLIFISKNIKFESCYKLHVHTDGIIEYKTVGLNKKCKLEIVDNILSIIN